MRGSQAAEGNAAAFSIKEGSPTNNNLINLVL